MFFLKGKSGGRLSGQGQVSVGPSFPEASREPNLPLNIAIKHSFKQINALWLRLNLFPQFNHKFSNFKRLNSICGKKFCFQKFSNSPSCTCRIYPLKPQPASATIAVSRSRNGAQQIHQFSDIKKSFNDPSYLGFKNLSIYNNPHAYKNSTERRYVP